MENEKIIKEVSRLKTIKNASMVALAIGAVISSTATLVKVGVDWRGSVLLEKAKKLQSK